MKNEGDFAIFPYRFSSLRITDCEYRFVFYGMHTIVAFYFLIVKFLWKLNLKYDTQRENVWLCLIKLSTSNGYGDLSEFGAQAISTPNIDALAHEGLAMDNFYSASGVCSPSRAGLLTGRYPLRTHLPTVFHQKTYGVMTILDLFNLTSYGMPGFSPDEVPLVMTTHNGILIWISLPWMK